MSATFVLTVGYLQTYQKKAGIGTLVSFTLPAAMAMMAAWTALFAVVRPGAAAGPRCADPLIRRYSGAARPAAPGELPDGGGEIGGAACTDVPGGRCRGCVHSPPGVSGRTVPPPHIRRGPEATSGPCQGKQAAVE
ncbi:AbgT family transporter [Streptomyces hawaiiensis]|uniref:AbgT family transporter n=1 Tax=Streptomyces hawaiiensis TaxID=67305 RepID=UPI003647DA50